MPSGSLRFAAGVLRFLVAVLEWVAAMIDGPFIGCGETRRGVIGALAGRFIWPGPFASASLIVTCFDGGCLTISPFLSPGAPYQAGSPCSYRTVSGSTGFGSASADRSSPAIVAGMVFSFRFDGATGEMVLESLHPGVELAEVQEEVGWELKRCPEPVEGVAPNLSETKPPTEEELRLLREELDPQGLYR